MNHRRLRKKDLSISAWEELSSVNYLAFQKKIEVVIENVTINL
jgi:hypothetical protein